MTGRAECAYLFPERLKERLDEGHYTRAVRVLVSPSTVAEKIISEKIFSELFEVYGRELLADYGEKWSGIPDGDGALPDDGGAGKGVRRADGTL